MRAEAIVKGRRLTFVLQDFRLERWVLARVQGAEPRLIFLPRLPAGWRWLWEGEVIPAGAELYDWREEGFFEVRSSLGTILPPDPLHNCLGWVPVRVRT